jgi:hypothetical protein
MNGFYIHFCRDSLGVMAAAHSSTTHTQMLCLMDMKHKQKVFVPVQKLETI